jgi:hypothetical protein
VRPGNCNKARPQYDPAASLKMGVLQYKNEYRVSRD